MIMRIMYCVEIMRLYYHKIIGFVPCGLCEDDDTLDILVLMQVINIVSPPGYFLPMCFSKDWSISNSRKAVGFAV